MTIRVVSWAGTILIVLGVLVIVLLKGGRVALTWGCGSILVGLVLMLGALWLAAVEIRRQSRQTRELIERTLRRAEQDLPPRKGPPPAPPESAS